MGTMIAIAEPAPSFRLVDLDGIERSPAQARGSILVINFWSAECPWSERADRQLRVYLDAWNAELQLWCIASNANESEQQIRQVAQERRLPVVLLDRDQNVARLYQVRTTPHMFVLDKTGVLCYRGAFDNRTFRKKKPDRRYLYDAVSALLEGRNPQPEETDPYGCAVVFHS